MAKSQCQRTGRDSQSWRLAMTKCGEMERKKREKKVVDDIT